MPRLRMIPLFLWIGISAALAEDNVFYGLGRNGAGWIQMNWGAGRGNQLLGWTRLPWTDYASRSGECRVATGDVDGDGNDELVVGTGRMPGEAMWIAVFDDAAHGCRFLRWIQLVWLPYSRVNGETFPACGDLDGDGYDEIVVGLGPGGAGWSVVIRADGTKTWLRLPGSPIGDGATRPACGDLDGDGKDEVCVGTGRGGGARVAVFDDASASCAFLRWLTPPQDAYATQVGAARPACGDLDGDGDAEVVVGRDPFPADGGYLAKFASLRDGGAFSAWLRVPWTNYNTRDGETRPALGDTNGDRKDELLVGLGAGGQAWASWHKSDGSFDRWAQVVAPQVTAPDGGLWPAIARGRSMAMFAALFLDYNLSSGDPLPDSTLDSIVARCSRERVTRLIVGTWSTKGNRRGVMWAKREPGKADLLNGNGTSAFLAGGRGFSLQHLIDAGRAARPPVEVYTSIVDFGENTGVSPYQDAHSDFLRNTVIRYIVDNYTGLAGVYLDYIRYAGNVDTFEAGVLGYFPFTGGWAATQTSAGAGTWSARSGATADGARNTMEMTVSLPAGGTFSFKRRVSSESGADFLRFSIDGAERERWSGEVAWGTSSYPVTAGTHTFTFSYTKDGATAAGSDCAWVDDVKVPSVDHTKVTRLVEGIHADLAPRGLRLGAFMMGWAGVTGWQSYLPSIGQHWEDLSERLDVLSPMAYAGWSSYYTTLDAMKNRVREKTRWAVDACVARRSKARVQSIIANYTDSTMNCTPLTIFSSLAAENEGATDEFSIFRWGHMDRGTETGEWDAMHAYVNDGPAPAQ